MFYKVFPLYNGAFTVNLDKDTPFFSNINQIPSFIFLAVDEDHEITLIDTGFDPLFIPGYQSEYQRQPEEELPALLDSKGYSVNDVSRVIQTHLHWDHTGHMQLFPHADFYLQVQELQALTRINHNAECSFITEHWLSLLDRFILVNGEYEIKPGMKVYLTGGHTEGHQVVTLNTRGGLVLLAGDAPFIYEDWWKVVSQEYWDKYRQGHGRHLFWDDSVRPQITAFLESKGCNNIIPAQPADYRQLKKLSKYTLFSHDPRKVKNRPQLSQ